MGVFLGVVSTVAFAALHLPYFYFVGFISGFISLLPYLGTDRGRSSAAGGRRGTVARRRGTV